MKLKIYKYLTTTLLAIFVAGNFAVQAQNYPVNVNTILTPPYSLYLSDYASPDGNSLQVMLHLLELVRP